MEPITDTVPIATPSFSVELPAGHTADFILTMTLGEFAVTVTLMLVMVLLTLILFQGWGDELRRRTRGSGE